ncbi:DUF4124 domain-containing protein [Geomonas propionica]|uniref:DUF4124 domain-containing protein n=1 Tax=Geomonas propionica TaxID=2798582 RepID=A0ABS0YN39_9BACT|nr:DUF4124 domain-containing protein [Geomonas propionica]MBJ6799329.1 DUF4124 domain-containing protein [Geomonas propionica]
MKLSVLTSFVLCMLAAVPALAETYKWEDSNGVHFTDNLNSVPKKYRKQAAAEARGDVAIPLEESHQAASSWKTSENRDRRQSKEDAVERAREAVASIPALRTSADFGGDGSNSAKDNAAAIKAAQHNANVIRDRDFKLRQLALALKERDGQSPEADTILSELNAEKQERKLRAVENNQNMKSLQMEQRLDRRHREMQDKLDRIDRKTKLGY